MSEEIFLPVVGYEGLYEVSNLGRVNVLSRKSWNHSAQKYSIFKSKILKPQMKNTGYYRVHLWKNSIQTSFSVHRLVAIAFIPNEKQKPFVNHINGDKGDNRVKNLEWVTQSENEIHAHKIGLKCHIGVKHPMAKLNGESIKIIRLLLCQNIKGRDIAKMYHISESVISNIKNNKIWTHI